MGTNHFESFESLEELREQLEALREQIDGIDEELVGLLLERFRVSEEIARVKAKAGYRVTDEDREAYVLEHVKQIAAEADAEQAAARQAAARQCDAEQDPAGPARGGAYDEALERIFCLLMEESKGRQRKVIGLG